MARNRTTSGKLTGQFLALPHSVLRSKEFTDLNHAAVRLLILLGLTYNGANNGKLVASRRYLQKMGWTSADTTVRSLKELQRAGLVVQTRMGRRPNVAAWYALAWRDLDQQAGLDFRPGAYPRFVGTPIGPLVGHRRKRIAPSSGQVVEPACPMPGAIAVQTTICNVRLPERI